MNLINEPVIAIVELLLRTGKEDLSIGLAQRVLVIPSSALRSVSSRGSAYSMRVSRPEAEIVLKALNFWVCKSKMTRSSGILVSDAVGLPARIPQLSIQRSAKVR